LNAMKSNAGQFMSGFASFDPTYQLFLHKHVGCIPCTTNDNQYGN
jgi:hypothetical protein